MGQLKTFRIEYSSDEELKRKLSSIILSLEDWQNFESVREWFGLKSNTLTMRLARFEKRGGSFPKVLDGRGIKRIKITPKLAEYLSQDFRNGKLT